METKNEKKVVSRKKTDYCRTGINIPIDLDLKYRELAKKRGIPKAQMILFAMSWYLDYSNSLDVLPALLDTINQAGVFNTENKKLNDNNNQ